MIPSANALPIDYLTTGYYATVENGSKKYLRPEHVSGYAREIASALGDMRPADFSVLLREMKRNRSSKLPYEAKQTAACEMLPKAIALVSRKRAPQILVTLVEANISTLHNNEDWTALYRHLEAIQGFLSLPKDDV